MRKTEPWTKSEIHYRGWLRRRQPDKSKLQISFDARKEQLNIYKTAGKKKKNADCFSDFYLENLP